MRNITRDRIPLAIGEVKFNRVWREFAGAAVGRKSPVEKVKKGRSFLLEELNARVTIMPCGQHADNEVEPEARLVLRKMVAVKKIRRSDKDESDPPSRQS